MSCSWKSLEVTFCCSDSNFTSCGNPVASWTPLDRLTILEGCTVRLVHERVNHVVDRSLPILGIWNELSQTQRLVFQCVFLKSYQKNVIVTMYNKQGSTCCFGNLTITGLYTTWMWEQAMLCRAHCVSNERMTKGNLPMVLMTRRNRYTSPKCLHIFWRSFWHVKIVTIHKIEHLYIWQHLYSNFMI